MPSRGRPKTEEAMMPIPQPVSSAVRKNSVGNTVHLPCRQVVADPVANWPSISAKCWSEWQDLNLRPPRPERGALPDCATLRLVGGLITTCPQGRKHAEQRRKCR